MRPPTRRATVSRATSLLDDLVQQLTGFTRGHRGIQIEGIGVVALWIQRASDGDVTEEALTNLYVDRATAEVLDALRHGS